MEHTSQPRFQEKIQQATAAVVDRVSSDLSLWVPPVSWSSSKLRWDLDACTTNN